MFNILIADDEPLIRRGLKTIIHRISDDFVVSNEASNGIDAMNSIECWKPDVVISDIKMPKKDGLELLEEINQKYPYIITVILSGYDDFNYAQKAIKYKVYDYLLKPVDSESLSGLLVRIGEEIKSRVSDRVDKEYMNMHIEGRISTLFSTIKLYDLILNIKLMNKQAIKTIIDDIFRYINDNNMDLFHVRHVILELYNTILNDLHNINRSTEMLNSSLNLRGDLEHLGSIESVRIWFEQNIMSLIEYSKEKIVNGDTKIIDKIKRYIRENYEKEITLNLLAEKFFLNPCYMSNLFKLETGQNFLEYLTQVRINKSIELMHDIRLKVYQISQMVGYESPIHFNKLFKRVTGITPNEYRKKACNY